MCNHQAYAGSAMHGRRWAGAQRGGFQHHGSIPVNIEEKDDQFEISLYAPGLQKENFQLSVKDDLLFITYKKPESTEPEKGAFTRREYHAGGFERSFLLKRKVEVDQISATYQEGILKVTLPKNPETNKPARSIEVE